MSCRRNTSTTTNTEVVPPEADRRNRTYFFAFLWRRILAVTFTADAVDVLEEFHGCFHVFFMIQKKVVFCCCFIYIESILGMMNCLVDSNVTTMIIIIIRLQWKENLQVFDYC